MKVSQGSAYALHALMYMVRHVTQLPVTSKAIAKAEGMPEGYLAKVMQQLAKAGLIQSVRGRGRGYALAKSPDEISLLELFEAFEGRALFDECPLKYCDCHGTVENCRIYSSWADATKQLKTLFEETSISTAAWSHPDHRFDAAFSLRPLGNGDPS